MLIDARVVVVKVGSDPIDTAKVNAIQIAFHRKRIPHIVPHINFKFYCFTDDPTGLDTEFGMEIIPLTRKDYITDPEFYKCEILNNTDWDDDQVILLDINTTFQDLCQKAFVDRCPLKGQVSELPEHIKFTAEEIFDIRENNLPFVVCGAKWWDNNKPFSTAFINFNGGDLGHVRRIFEENPAKAQETDFETFFINTFKGKYVHLEAGSIGPYIVGSPADTDATFTPLWDEHVRPLFPEQWNGQGGDMDDKYIYAEHEWKTVNKQTKILQFTNNDNPFKDLFARTWLL